MRNSAGQVVISKHVTFCPNSFNPARVNPASPPTTPYPTQCGFNPFTVSMVWGVQKGWAAEPVQFVNGKLPLGVYHLTETISPEYTRLFHIAARDATANVRVDVVKQPRCCPEPGCCGPSSRAAQSPGAARPAATGRSGPLKTRQPRRCLTLCRCPRGSVRVRHQEAGQRGPPCFRGVGMDRRELPA